MRRRVGGYRGFARPQRHEPAGPSRPPVPQIRPMTAGQYRQGSSWTAKLAWGLLLLLVGAALATWGLSRWETGARFFGVGPGQPLQVVRQPQQLAQPAAPQ